MLSSRHAAPCLMAAILLCSSVAHGQLQQICHSGAQPPASTTWSNSLAIPRFDPELGNLISVAVSLTSRVTGSVRAENIGGGTTATLTFAATVRVRRPDNSVLLATNVQTVFNDPLTDFDGFLDFAGSSGVTHAGLDLPASTATTFPTPPADLALFTGPAGNPGTVALSLQGLGTSSSAGGASIVALFDQLAEANVQVCYTFDPTSGLRVQKSGMAPVPGRAVEYTITVRNTGQAPFQDLDVVESVDPRYFRLIDVTPPGIVADETLAALGLVVWRIPALAPGEQRILSYRAILDPYVPLGTVVPGGPVWAGLDLVPTWIACTESVQFLVGDCACAHFCCGSPCGTDADCLDCQAGCMHGCPEQGLECLAATRDLVNACVESSGRIVARYLDRATVVGPMDPNEKRTVNPQFIQPDEPLTYVVHYENLGDLPADYVVITDVLAPNLDASTLQLAPLPASCTNCSATYNPATRTILWNLQAHVKAGEGGSVQFVVSPNPGLPPGTVVTNQAGIQFEVQPVITTGIVANTIDGIRPVGTMGPLAPVQPAEQFTLTWSGSDAVGGELEYTVYVSRDGGGFEALFVGTTATSAPFTGQAGSRFDFYCIARDIAGNVEQQVPLPEASTTVLATAPSFCAGDGSSTQCPCGNASALGAGEGCLHSLGTGGKLAVSGAASVAHGSLRLSGSRMPSGPASYFQGSSAANGGLGTPFGDGLRCVDGTVFRLGTTQNVNGMSQYPEAGDPPIAARGFVLPGQIRVYQCWFRNTAVFCTPAGFNLTNGLRVTWGP